MFTPHVWRTPPTFEAHLRAGSKGELGRVSTNTRPRYFWGSKNMGPLSPLKTAAEQLRVGDPLRPQSLLSVDVERGGNDYVLLQDTHLRCFDRQLLSSP